MMAGWTEPQSPVTGRDVKCFVSDDLPFLIVTMVSVQNCLFAALCRVCGLGVGGEGSADIGI